jgi:H-type lectin domain-containing protein
MSDLTSELNLALCVDDDDTADYLTTTQGLRGSLLTLDGLFSTSTGHAHNGAHQGGTLHDLAIGGTFSVAGLATLNSLDVTTTSHLRGAVTFDTALQPGGTLTIGQDLTVTRNAAINGSLTVAGSISGPGAITLSGNLSGANVIASGYITAGPVLSGAAGDLNANRGGTGYVFLGNTTHYLGFDGTYYQLPGSTLYIAGDRAVTEVAAQTLANKTLTTPTINGAAAWNTAQNLVGPSKQSNFPILGQVANASDWLVDYGASPLVTVPNGGLANQAYSFNRAFSTAPFVIASLGFFSGSVNTLQLVNVAAHNVTASGLQIDFANQSGGQQSMVATWIAIGR